LKALLRNAFKKFLGLGLSAKRCNCYVIELSTGQKFNGVEESLGIEMKVKDEVTQEIKATTKNAFR
jgi:hypothetical protein